MDCWVQRGRSFKKDRVIMVEGMMFVFVFVDEGLVMMDVVSNLFHKCTVANVCTALRLNCTVL